MLSARQYEHYQDNYLANPGDKEVTKLREFVAGIRSAIKKRDDAALIRSVESMVIWKDTHTITPEIVSIIDDIADCPDNIENTLHDHCFHLLVTSGEAFEYANESAQERRYEASNAAFYYSVAR